MTDFPKIDRWLRSRGSGTAVAVAVTGIAVFWAMLSAPFPVQIIAVGIFSIYILGISLMLWLLFWHMGRSTFPVLEKHRIAWGILLSSAFIAFLVIQNSY